MKNGCSDRLVQLTDSKEKLSFKEIAELLHGQIDEELETLTPEDFPELEPDYLPTLIATCHEVVDLALEIYRQAKTEEEAVQAMQRSENKEVQKIGRALETGNWAPLAI